MGFWAVSFSSGMTSDKAASSCLLLLCRQRLYMVCRTWFAISRWLLWPAVDLKSSMSVSMALEFWRASWVDESMLRFLTNFNMVT